MNKHVIILIIYNIFIGVFIMAYSIPQTSSSEEKSKCCNNIDHVEICIVVRDESDRIFTIKNDDGALVLPFSKDIYDESKAFDNLHSTLLSKDGIDIIQCEKVCVRKYVSKSSGRDITITKHIFEATEYSIDTVSHHSYVQFIPIGILKRMKNKGDTLSSYLGVTS